MDRDRLARERQAIIDQYGEWTLGRLHLGNGIYTKEEPSPGIEIHLRRIVQLIADTADKPFDKLRIIDLGCLEGLHSIELASKGATVLGIEARQANIAKAEFSSRALSLHNLEFHQDDVRNVRKERYGEFDVVLCMG